MSRKYRSVWVILTVTLLAALFFAAGCSSGSSDGPAAAVLGDTRLLALKPVPGEDRLKQLVTITADGDRIKTRELAMAYAYEVAPDGKSVAFVGEDGIYLAGLDGSGKTRISELSPRFDLNSDQERLVGGVMSWAPDGSRLAFVCGGDLYTVSIKTGQKPVLMARRTADDLKTMEGAPARAPRIEGIIGPAWTDNGNIIYQDFFRRYDGRWQQFCNIVKINVNSRKKTVVLNGGQEPLLSPDRTKMLYYQENGAAGQVKVAGIDGSGAKALAPLMDRDGAAQYYAWSRDGRYAVFARFAVDTETGKRAVYAGDPGLGNDGAGPGRITGPAVFSPGGRWAIIPADEGPLLLKCAGGGFSFDTPDAFAVFKGLDHFSWIKG